MLRALSRIVGVWFAELSRQIHDEHAWYEAQAQDQVDDVHALPDRKQDEYVLCGVVDGARVTVFVAANKIVVRKTQCQYYR